MPVLGREPGTQVFRDLTENPADEQPAGIVVLRMDGGLFFATSDALEDRVRSLVQEGTGVRAVVLSLEGVNYMDSQGAAAVGNLVDLTADAGVELRLARVKPGVRAVLDRDGVVERLGSDHVHGNVHRAVQAVARDHGSYGISPCTGSACSRC
jgi:sulfate permease, SulP family